MLNRIALHHNRGESYHIASCFISIFSVSYRWLCIEMRIASASVMEIHIPNGLRSKMSQNTKHDHKTSKVLFKQHKLYFLYLHFTFTFMHLADAFIQSDLQCIQAINFFFFISMCVPWELNPRPFALLTQCSTTEPQEHYAPYIYFMLNVCLMQICLN